MRNVKDLIPAATSGKHVGAASAPQPRSVDQGTASVVNSLFAELQCIFPAWKQAWPDEDSLKAAKRSWIKGFMAAGINSLEQIRFGIQQCRKSGGEFAPSVGRFIKWCEPTPEMLGLPDAAKAYREACANAHPAADRKWSHPAVHHAACETGFYELANLSEERSRKLFDRNYAITVRMVMTGQPLREIPLALPETVTVRTPEVGRENLQKLREMFKGGRG
ncbi:replication protein P [Pseudomonas sp. PS1]|uniref:Replication protein P n=1 Tax=Stutzerimonas marianensis TaxID=2929513 RepID=A0A9X1W0P0_9GAMM|nr:replication protein P [Pseudomonas marianensis]MCJ0972706.1 replication protein P [Pseudomonas marianensis]